MRCCAARSGPTRSSISPCARCRARPTSRWSPACSATPSNTWWRFLDQAERNTRAARFESLLREGLAQADTPSQKASWFGTLRNVSITPATVTWLRQVWEKKDTVIGSAARRGRLHRAGAGARRAAGGWLERHPRRPAGPHRKSGSQGALPVRDAGALRGSGDAREVVRVVARCQQPAARAVGARRPRLPPSSAARRGLEEIRATEPGDCCGRSRRPATFSSRSGGSTPPSAATRAKRSPTRCGRFSRSLPANYPERLRNITLQSADELYRAAEIVK